LESPIFVALSNVKKIYTGSDLVALIFASVEKLKVIVVVSPINGLSEKMLTAESSLGRSFTLNSRPSATPAILYLSMFLSKTVISLLVGKIIAVILNFSRFVLILFVV
jgi:hypothetical protein